MLKCAILVYRVASPLDCVQRVGLASFCRDTRSPTAPREAEERGGRKPPLLNPAFTMPSAAFETAAARDVRLDLVRAWVTSILGTRAFAIVAASADASFRRYFRVTPDVAWRGQPTLIAMDAPPPMEDCRPFVHVARLLGGSRPKRSARARRQTSAAGSCSSPISATERTSPRSIAASAAGLYSDAIDALIRWQSATRARGAAELRRGAAAPASSLCSRTGTSGNIWASSFRRRKVKRSMRCSGRSSTTTSAQPRVYVHRDYHSRNLMVATPNPGVLDFQDAVIGPVTYDLASLLRDAYIAWDEERQIDWAVRYWERARKARLPVGDDFAAFWRDFEWMGVQRQLKVLGIFARLHHRDGKAAYVDDMPRVMAYLPSRLRDDTARWTAAVPARRARSARPRRRACSEAIVTIGIGAMILAAGRGERMRPLSDATPKPLLEVGGKPLIAWQIEALARAGFRDIVINASHLADRLIAALGDGSRLRCEAALVARARGHWRRRAASRPRCRCCREAPR